MLTLSILLFLVYRYIFLCCLYNHILFESFFHLLFICYQELFLGFIFNVNITRLCCMAKYEVGLQGTTQLETSCTLHYHRDLYFVLQG